MATGIGETLRAARRRHGVSLADAAAETRIRESYLAALESEEFSALGGDVYVKGFLRSYARYLALDPEPLLEEYRSSHEPGDASAGIAGTPVAAPVSREPRQPGLVVVGAAVVLLLVVLAAIGFAGPDAEDDPQEAVAPAPVAPTTEPVPAETTAPPVEVETAEPQEPDEAEEDEAEPVEGVEVVVEVTGGDSWMRVVVDGENVLEGIRSDGFSETFSGDEVALRLGDPSVVSITVNGEDQGALGSPGVPVDLVYPDDAA